MLFGGADYVELELSDQRAVELHHGQIGLDALSDSGIAEMLSDPYPMALTGQIPSEARQVILAVGILDVAQQFRPFADQVSASSQEISSGPHIGRIDEGLAQHASSQQGGYLMGIDLVVLGLSSVDGFHVQSMPQDEGDVFLGAEVSEPIPGEDTLYCDHNVLSVRRNGLQKGLRLGTDVSMEDYLSVMVQDAEIHGPGVEINATIVAVLLGVESHEVSSLLIGPEVQRESRVSCYHQAGASMSVIA